MYQALRQAILVEMMDTLLGFKKIYKKIYIKNIYKKIYKIVWFNHHNNNNK